MYAERNTEEMVRDRMLEKIKTPEIDKSEGTFTHDVVSVYAAEMEQAYQNMDRILEVVFAQTSYGEYLDRRAAEFGIFRKMGEKATTIVRFFGNDGAVVPVGTSVSTEGGLRYETTQSGTVVDGYVDIPVVAREVGVDYNVPAGVITVLPQTINGITGVTNPDPVTNGVDVETDEALFARLNIRVRTPATSGNIEHYRAWALEVSGIGDAKVMDTWNGNGTVKVVVISDQKRAVTAEKVEEVYNHIEEVRPIGANVTVVTAQEKAIDVSVNVVLKPGYSLDEVTDNITVNIAEYLKESAFAKTYISYAIIGSLIMESEGVEDYANLRVNGGTENVLIGTEEIAYLGNVVVTNE